ncbi:MAG: type III-A CRISPR-associated RAMP protein Csm5 [Anaerolineae bacterium]
MPDYTLYNVKVTVLSPLHIGSGRDLLNEYDYAIYQGQTWRINEDTLLEAQNVDDPAIADRLAQTPPAQLLRAPADFRPDSRLFRYVIKGTPRATGTGAEVREQFKDVYDRPYLPGTTLKGALRTALGWLAWEKRGLRPDRTKLGRDRRFAAQQYEHELFGRDPNHDLLRALQVGDSAPVGVDRLMIVNARVLNRGGKPASPIELEALRPDTVFELTLKIDNVLFSSWAQAHGLKMPGAALLRELPGVVQAHTAQRLAREAEWFARIPGADKVAAYYRQLRDTRLSPSAFFIQIGWGAGWEGKTFGSRLQADSNFMETIVRHPKEGGYGLARGQRKPGDPFPKSRRVLVQVQRGPDGRTVEIPHSPLGWVLVEIH